MVGVEAIGRRLIGFSLLWTPLREKKRRRRRVKRRRRRRRRNGAAAVWAGL